MDKETQQYIDEQLKNLSQKQLFSTQNASYHTHNGVDSPTLYELSFIKVGSGIPTANITAKEGTLYINTTPTSGTSRFYVMTAGGTNWAYFTASA